VTADNLISPKATARFVVTLPPGRSRVADALAATAGAAFTTLTDTQDAFLHLARRARARLVIMIPFIDRAGATWAAELFEATSATKRVLILRDRGQLLGLGRAAARLEASLSEVLDYNFVPDDGRPGNGETFHAKIVLADGVAAYVGSANLLRRSRDSNLECGMLLEGPAVQSINVLINAVLATFAEPMPPVQR
jgi:phosphatidylserine/phosphatidylglycerophosphate/cardiolipin synthase-like enzyme